jgi:2'-5' RNA ligase
MKNKLSEYEISIRICFPETITKILKHEKDRFVTEYRSNYKSDPHITVYMDRYTQEGFPQLIHDLQELRVHSFSFSLLKPKIRREENRLRNLYIIDVSNKEQIRELHTEVSQIAIRYCSPLLRSKVQQRLEQQGIHTDGTRESLKSTPEAEKFDPHITLGDVGFDDFQPNLTDVQNNLKELEGKQVVISDLIVFFYGKVEGDEKFKLIEKVSIPLRKDL